MHWLVLSLIFVQSLSAQSVKSRTSVGGPKDFYSAQLEIKTTSTPRDDLGNAIKSDKTVQQCLRASLQNSGDDFSVTVSGRLAEDGTISSTRADTYATPPLAQCMQEAVNGVKMKTAGKAGEFSLTIQRSRVTGGEEKKTFMLDLNNPQNP